MAVNPLKVFKYRLRQGGVQQNYNREFIFQTFGADKQQVDIYPAIFDLVTSDHMQGQGGQLDSASYNRTQYKDVDNPDKGTSYTGQEVWPVDFIEETLVPGQDDYPDYQPNFVT